MEGYFPDWNDRALYHEYCKGFGNSLRSAIVTSPTRSTPQPKDPSHKGGLLQGILDSQTTFSSAGLVTSLLGNADLGAPSEPQTGWQQLRHRLNNAQQQQQQQQRRPENTQAQQQEGSQLARQQQGGFQAEQQWQHDAQVPYSAASLPQSNAPERKSANGGTEQASNPCRRPVSSPGLQKGKALKQAVKHGVGSGTTTGNALLTLSAVPPPVCTSRAIAPQQHIRWQHPHLPATLAPQGHQPPDLQAAKTLHITEQGALPVPSTAPATHEGRSTCVPHSAPQPTQPRTEATGSAQPALRSAVPARLAMQPSRPPPTGSAQSMPRSSSAAPPAGLATLRTPGPPARGTRHTSAASASAAMAGRSAAERMQHYAAELASVGAQLRQRPQLSHASNASSFNSKAVSHICRGGRVAADKDGSRAQPDVQQICAANVVATAADVAGVGAEDMGRDPCYGLGLGGLGVQGSTLEAEAEGLLQRVQQSLAGALPGLLHPPACQQFSQQQEQGQQLLVQQQPWSQSCQQHTLEQPGHPSMPNQHQVFYPPPAASFPAPQHPSQNQHLFSLEQHQQQQHSCLQQFGGTQSGHPQQHLAAGSSSSSFAAQKHAAPLQVLQHSSSQPALHHPRSPTLNQPTQGSMGLGAIHGSISTTNSRSITQARSEPETGDDLARAVRSMLEFAQLQLMGASFEQRQQQLSQPSSQQQVSESVPQQQLSQPSSQQQVSESVPQQQPRQPITQQEFDPSVHHQQLDQPMLDRQFGQSGSQVCSSTNHLADQHRPDNIPSHDQMQDSCAEDQEEQRRHQLVCSGLAWHGWRRVLIACNAQRQSTLEACRVKRLAVLMLVWQQQAANAKAERAAQLEAQRQEHMQAKREQVACHFHCMWVKHAIMVQWQEVVQMAREQKQREQAQAHAAAREVQAEQHRYQIAARFHATYTIHRALRAWATATRLGRAVSTAAKEASHRQSAIHNLLARLQQRDAFSNSNAGKSIGATDGIDIGGSGPTARHHCSFQTGLVNSEQAYRASHKHTSLHGQPSLVPAAVSRHSTHPAPFDSHSQHPQHTASSPAPPTLATPSFQNNNSTAPHTLTAQLSHHNLTAPPALTAALQRQRKRAFAPNQPPPILLATEARAAQRKQRALVQAVAQHPFASCLQGPADQHQGSPQSVALDLAGHHLSHSWDFPAGQCQGPGDMQGPSGCQAPQRTHHKESSSHHQQGHPGLSNRQYQPQHSSSNNTLSNSSTQYQPAGHAMPLPSAAESEGLRRQLQAVACCFPAGSAMRADLEAVAAGPQAELLRMVQLVREQLEALAQGRHAPGTECNAPHTGHAQPTGSGACASSSAGAKCSAPRTPNAAPPSSGASAGVARAASTHDTKAHAYQEQALHRGGGDAELVCRQGEVPEFGSQAEGSLQGVEELLAQGEPGQSRPCLPEDLQEHAQCKQASQQQQQQQQQQQGCLQGQHPGGTQAQLSQQQHASQESKRRVSQGSLATASSTSDKHSAEDAARLLAAARAAEARRRRTLGADAVALEATLQAEAWALACMHYRRALMLKYCWQPLHMLMRNATASLQLAESHCQRHLLLASLRSLQHCVMCRRWLRASKQAAGVGVLRCAGQAALVRCCWRGLHLWWWVHHSRRASLARCVLRSLRMSVQWRRLGMRDAKLHCRDRSMRGCLRAWHGAAESQAGQRIVAQLQKEQHADEHAAAACMRRCVAWWREAVFEGRASHIQAQHQAATWSKINGWLSEVAARQQVQPKISLNPEGICSSPIARISSTAPSMAAAGCNMGPCIPTPSTSAASATCVSGLDQHRSAIQPPDLHQISMAVPNLIDTPQISVVSHNATDPAAAQPGLPTDLTIPCLCPAADGCTTHAASLVGTAASQPQLISAPLCTYPGSNNVTSSDIHHSNATCNTSSAASTNKPAPLLPFDLPPLGSSTCSSASKPFAFLEPNRIRHRGTSVHRKSVLASSIDLDQGAEQQRMSSSTTLDVASGLNTGVGAHLEHPNLPASRFVPQGAFSGGNKENSMVEEANRDAGALGSTQASTCAHTTVPHNHGPHWDCPRRIAWGSVEGIGKAGGGVVQGVQLGQAEGQCGGLGQRPAVKPAPDQAAALDRFASPYSGGSGDAHSQDQAISNADAAPGCAPTSSSSSLSASAQRLQSLVVRSRRTRSTAAPPHAWEEDAMPRGGQSNDRLAAPRAWEDRALREAVMPGTWLGRDPGTAAGPNPWQDDCVVDATLGAAVQPPLPRTHCLGTEGKQAQTKSLDGLPAEMSSSEVVQEGALASSNQELVRRQQRIQQFQAQRLHSRLK